MSFNFKSKLVLVDKGVVVTSFLVPVGSPGQAAYVVPVDFQVKAGDLFDGVAVTPDPDASKKAALQAELEKAVLALQSADDKAAAIKALSDATAAIQPLADVSVKP